MAGIKRKDEIRRMKTYGIRYVVTVTKMVFPWEEEGDSTSRTTSTGASFTNDDDFEGDYRQCPARTMAEACWKAACEMLLEYEVDTEADIKEYPRASGGLPASYYGEYPCHDDEENALYEVAIFRHFAY